MESYFAKLRGESTAVPELPDVALQMLANDLGVLGPVEQSDSEPVVKAEAVRAEVDTEPFQDPVPIKGEPLSGPSPPSPPSPPWPLDVESGPPRGDAKPTLHSESLPMPHIAAKRRRLIGKTEPSVYQKLGFSVARAKSPVRAGRKQPGPLSDIPRGSPDHEYLEARRLPRFVAQAAEATDMEAVAESLKNFCAVQMPMAQLKPTSKRPLKISIGTMCSGSEMYITSLPELQAVIRAAAGIEVYLDHAWSCEWVRWKREWIWRNFNPRKIFSDAADLCKDEGFL